MLCFSVRINSVPFHSNLAIALHVNMKRLVFPTIEEEREPIEYEYFWHIINILSSLRCKYRYYLQYQTLQTNKNYTHHIKNFTILLF